MGWKKGDRRNFGDVIRRGMEGNNRGKEWTGLPQDVIQKREILEGREGVCEKRVRER